MQQNLAPYPGYTQADDMRSTSLIRHSMDHSIFHLTDLTDKVFFQFSHQGSLDIKIFVCKLSRKTKPCNSRYILCTGTDIPLLATTEQNRPDLHFLTNI